MQKVASARNLAAEAFTRLGHPKTAAYIGWAGQGNLGDDAMFAAAHSLIGRKPLVLGSAKIERLLARVGLSGPTMFDCAILGGGTMINAGYLTIVRQCFDQGLPLFALGTGVGSAGFSMEEEMPGAEWAQALTRFEAVGVRGPLSREKLVQAGFSGAEVVGDLALALTPDTPVAAWAARRFIVNCAPARSDRDRALMDRVQAALAEAVGRLARDGWTPLPVAFDRADVAPTARLLQMAGLAQVPVSVPRSFADYANIASRASWSLGVRLHSAVLAAACGVVPVLIGYRDKCRDFAGSLDDDRMVIPLDSVDADMILDAARQAIDCREDLGRVLHERCLNWRGQLERFAQRQSALRA